MPLRFPVLLLLACAGCGAQQYPFIPIAGSPKNIEHIIQDRQGRIWIGTLDDVLCFDGARFFSLHDSGFPQETTFSLAEDDEGGILIGAQYGAYRFFAGRLEKLPVDDIQTRAIGVEPGVVLVWGIKTGGYATAVYRVRRVGNVWRSTQITGWTVGEFVTRDRTGSILTACAGGWCEYSRRSIEDWSPAKSAPPNFHRSNETFQRIFKDRSGCLWFRTLESAAYQCPGDSMPVPLPAVVAGRNVWASVEEMRDGSILFANAASLAAGRPGAFQIATPENGLPADTISSAIQAKDGAIWAGTIKGLYRFPHPFRMSYWNSRYGPFWAIARAGSRMFAGSSAGIATLGIDGEWRVLPATRGLGSISSLLAEPDGSLYAAVSGSTVIHLRMPDGAIDARLANGQAVQPQFLAQGAGGMWVAGAGYYRLVRRGGELIASAESPSGVLPPDPFIAADPSGGIWGCFSGALIHYQPAGWRTVARDGVPPGLCRSLAFSGGDVWTGYNTGFAWVRVNAGGESQVRPFKTSGNAGAGIAWAFGTDRRGWLWRGSLDGMFVATEAQAQRGAWIGLGEADGLSVLDVNHNAFFGDSDGSVWWAADVGVFHFTPQPDFIEPPSAPDVFISAFSVGAQPPRLAETFDQFPSRQELMVHLASLQFEERSAIRVRYRMLPEQKDWREPASFDLDLGSPSWGNHTLEVQTRFTTGEWSPAQSRVLVMMPPWWFSWPALLAFAAMGCAGASGGMAWHRKLKARAGIHLPDLDLFRAAMLTPESLLPGTTLDGRFHVLHVIARGGFANVLKGRDLRTQRFCAIKVFRQEVLDEEWVTHRFQQEVSALEQIRDRSVVSIYGHGIAPEGAPYLVMELIEGGTLRELLKNGPLSLDCTASLLQQAAHALGQIHAHGIFHRDLKPENLMLRKNAPPGKELVLIDFSIAIVKAPDHTVHGISRAAGTIYYMAPEQAVGFATAASDIYSLAKILLELLTGQKLSTLLPHANMDLPERVRDLARAMPFHLSEESVELLGSALEFDPARRPQVAQAFAAPIVRDLLAASSGRAANLDPSPKDGESAAGSTR